MTIYLIMFTFHWPATFEWCLTQFRMYKDLITGVHCLLPDCIWNEFHSLNSALAMQKRMDGLNVKVMSFFPHTVEKKYSNNLHFSWCHFIFFKKSSLRNILFNSILPPTECYESYEARCSKQVWCLQVFDFTFVVGNVNNVKFVIKYFFFVNKDLNLCRVTVAF